MNDDTGKKWGALGISIFALVLQAGALVVAVIIKNETMLNILVGTISANATTVIGYWVGSSAGSAAKSITLEKQLPTPPTTVVAAVEDVKHDDTKPASPPAQPSALNVP